MWIFTPALVWMVLYGATWFLLGTEYEEDRDADGAAVLGALILMAFFGYPIYLGLVEVMG